MTTARQLTANTYFLKNAEGITLGALIKEADESYLFLNPNEKTTFKYFEEVEARFGKIHYDKSVYEQNERNELNGYPTRHGTIDPYPIEGLDNYPTYKTGGNVIFAAGYWTLQMKIGHRFGVTWSPKLTTLSEGTHYGPFKNRIEALQEANIQNQRLEKELMEKENDKSV